ncbi:MAG: hypothetical protein K2K63_13040 [Acetatifactor sp.]|nr:hypothetical protein [Acetatifactor sp.]
MFAFEYNDSDNVKGQGCLSKEEWDTPDTNDFEFEECSTHYLDVTKGGECVRKYS